MYQLTFDTQAFIKQHWQQTPVVLTQAFADFVDPIAADELAGLACEEEISSRIVVTKDNQWDVIQGPFEDYDAYGETKWQLLVQAVNHWYPDSQPLVDAFRFLPDWRFDDLMVSFATPEGGVGPHIDNYDVFIIQGEGERRWKVGDKGHHQRRGGDATSPLVDDFEPIIDVVLKKGDVLYIPPGYPHCGETLSLALSYSIGFRAPSQQELLTQLADSLIDNNSGHKRFTSASEASDPGVVSETQQQGIMQLLAELATQPEKYQTMLGKLLSQNRFELDICEGEEPVTLEELQEMVQDNASIARIGGLKVLRLENDQQCRLFINGEVYPLEDVTEAQLLILANTMTLDSVNATDLLANASIGQLLVELLNQGLYYLAE
ncbi:MULTISPECIES: cupin domain-containing protein [Pseudomonadati]|uniref:Cupin domain-containing protein n=1 Tax=Shewanella aestuarii TaxID=1028752 RepID=A0ABT0KXC7_9GAMM|nr:cupin domain-containing protein [Shewanella aestuarii]MCL1115822.1 cupin domain-containing protein [Shewanella aestuarii]GGN68988.1 cupin [Shewanella aestuarii]